MTFIITPVISDSYSKEELASISDATLDITTEVLENGDVTDTDLKFDAPVGFFEFPDGSEGEFTEYKSTVVSAYRDMNGDRWFILADGGYVNVSELHRMLRRAVENARRIAE